MANNKTYPVQSQRSPAGLYCDRVKTTADAEKKALAIVPSDGFNWAFEELIVERVSDLLALGLSKEIVLKLLDLAVEVEKAKR